MVVRAMNVGKSLTCLFLFFVFTAYLPGQILAVNFNFVWSSAPVLPFQTSNHVSHLFNGLLSVISGSTSYVTNRVMFSSLDLNGISTNWIVTTPYSKSVFWPTSSSALSSIYIFGGNEYPGGVVVSSKYSYRGEIDHVGNYTWTSEPDLPDSLAYGASCLARNKVYVSGGGTWNNSNIGVVTVKDVVYMSEILSDGNLGPWQNAGTLPAKLLGHSMVWTGNKLYVLGGYDGDLRQATNRIWEAVMDADGKITSWNGPMSSSFLVNAYSFMTTIFQNHVVVAGGRGPNLHDSNTYDRVFYSEIQPDGTLGLWSESVNRLPRTTCCAGIAASDDRIYITGGHDGRVYFDSVWATAAVAPTPTLVPTLTPTPIPTATPIPTPTPIPITPVVLIPGMGGSWNYEALVHNEIVPQSAWFLTPFINTYDGLIFSLEHAGYEKGEELYLFAYDWRQPVIKNGQDLVNFVNETVLDEKPAGTKVNLVGHSMGGLVARAAYHNGLSEKTEKIVTYGTPHKGLAKAYLAWEGADFNGFSNWWQMLGIKLVLRLNTPRHTSEIETVRRVVPSIQNLLPIEPYLKNNKGDFISLGSMKWKNNFLNLNPAIDLSFASKLHAIYGSDIDTLKTIRVVSPSKKDVRAGLWDDGKPTKYENVSGDGAVVTSSAVMDASAGVYKLDGTDHGEIVYGDKGQIKLLEILGFEAPFTVFPQNPKQHKAIVVTISSPATFKLTAPGGSDYFPQENLLIVSDPVNGLYKITLNSTGRGAYRLHFGRFKDEIEAWSGETGIFLLPGQTKTYYFRVNFDSRNLGANLWNECGKRLGYLKNWVTDHPWDESAIVLSKYLPRLEQLINNNQIDLVREIVEELAAKVTSKEILAELRYMQLDLE